MKIESHQKYSNLALIETGRLVLFGPTVHHSVYLTGIESMMRGLGLSVENHERLRCMLNSTHFPRSDQEEFSVKLKPNFPFNLALATLIENYMCRIHKTLKDETGQGLPLDLYMKSINRVFRDKKRTLPNTFCDGPTHFKYDVHC